jgi:hypothetical protein
MQAPLVIGGFVLRATHRLLPELDNGGPQYRMGGRDGQPPMPPHSWGRASAMPGPFRRAHAIRLRKPPIKAGPLLRAFDDCEAGQAAFHLIKQPLEGIWSLPAFPRCACCRVRCEADFDILYKGIDRISGAGDGWCGG